MSKSGKSILFYFIVVLIAFSIIRLISNLQVLTFSTLVEFLGTCPNIPLPKIGSFSISADWGFFNFFKDFLNTFLPFFDVLGIAGACVVNAFIFVAWLLGFIMGAPVGFGV